MNIFEIYREQIVNLLKELSSQNMLQLPENLNSINVDIPPLKFDGDISSNVAMVLSKLNKKLKLGICGEHGGDPRSIEFCSKAGLNYVSCSPFRVPIARLAAAQAELRR